MSVATIEASGTSAAGTNAGAIHGWGCTPTGDPPSAAVSSQPLTKPSWLPAALHTGWRRTALYLIILLLMVLVFLNIALTLWIISALKLTMSGIGPMRIVRGGIELSGSAWVVDRLVTSVVASPPAQPLTLHSHRNFSVLVSEPHSPDHARLFMKRDSIVCGGRALHVEDSVGNVVFRASRDEVRLASGVLAVDGGGGLVVRGALQTRALHAPPAADLLLESATRRLVLRAPQSIALESRAGAIEITSHADIRMDSDVGAIRMHAPNIIISNLKEANITNQPQKGVKNVKVYQLCACATGRLFLAAPDALCEARDDDTDLCR